MPTQPMYRRPVLDHLGLVAGLCDALGLGDVLHPATPHNPAMRDLPVADAVTAMGRNGLGCITHALSLVPRFCHNTPPSRLIAPRVAPAQLHDAARGRTLATLSASGVTALSRLFAVRAATRLGLRPTSTHLDPPRFHVDGRYNRHAAPAVQVGPRTPGYSREHRPDRTPVVLAWSVAHQGGLAVLRQPLSGQSRAAQEVGQVSRAPLEPLHTPSGATSWGADRALYREDNRAQLAQPASKWIPRGPATVRAAPAALAPAKPQARAPLTAGDRSQAWTSTSGSVDQRGLLIASVARPPQAQRTVDKQRRQQRAQDGKPLQTLGGTPLAGEAEARQALGPSAQGVQATFLPPRPVCAQPR